MEKKVRPAILTRDREKELGPLYYAAVMLFVIVGVVVVVACARAPVRVKNRLAVAAFVCV